MSSSLSPIFGNNQGFPEVFMSYREIGAHSKKINKNENETIRNDERDSGDSKEVREQLRGS